MSKIEKQFRDLNERMIRLQTLRDEALRKLKDDFGIGSVEEAKEVIDRQETAIEKKERKLERQLEELESEFGDLL